MPSPDFIDATRIHFGQSPFKRIVGSLLIDTTTLPFNMEAQTETNWCWAATATSVSHFYASSSTWT